MATYYFEGYPIIAPLTIESVRIVLNSESASGKITRRAGEGQRWDLSFRVVTNDPEDLFITMLSNDIDTNTMIMPQLKTVDDKLSDITGYPSVNYEFDAGVSTVVADTSGLGSYNTNGVIPKGAFIKFSNHSKIYTVTTEVTESTTANISFFPPLQADVNGTVTILLPNTPIKPTFTYIRSLDQISGISYTDGVLVDAGVFTIQEKV